VDHEARRLVHDDQVVVGEDDGGSRSAVRTTGTAWRLDLSGPRRRAGQGQLHL
jgi:hypothetical protein